jgi:hypothetical protein
MKTSDYLIYAAIFPIFSLLQEGQVNILFSNIKPDSSSDSKIVLQYLQRIRFILYSPIKQLYFKCLYSCLLYFIIFILVFFRGFYNLKTNNYFVNVILFCIFSHLHLIHFLRKSIFINSHFGHIHTIFFFPHKNQRVKISLIYKILIFSDLKPISTNLFFCNKNTLSIILIFGGFFLIVK